MDLLHRLVAKPTLRRVDDALEREVIVRLGDDPQIGQRIADFGPLIEAETAHDPVGQANGNEAVLELAGLELGADQDRAILRPTAAGDMRLDPFADEAGLFRTVPHAHAAAFFAGLPPRPQGLAAPAANAI